MELKATATLNVTEVTVKFPAPYSPARIKMTYNTQIFAGVIPGQVAETDMPDHLKRKMIGILEEWLIGHVVVGEMTSG